MICHEYTPSPAARSLRRRHERRTRRAWRWLRCRARRRQRPTRAVTAIVERHTDGRAPPPGDARRRSVPSACRATRRAAGAPQARAARGAAPVSSGHASDAASESRCGSSSHRVTVTSKQVRPIGGYSVVRRHSCWSIRRPRERSRPLASVGENVSTQAAGVPTVQFGGASDDSMRCPPPKCSTRSGSAAAFSGARARAVMTCVPADSRR